MPLQQLALGRHLFALECQGRNACVPRLAVVFEQTGVQNTNALIKNPMASMTSTMTKPSRRNSPMIAFYAADATSTSQALTWCAS